MTLSRMDALAAIVAAMPHAPTVVTCGLTSRELASLDRRDNHLYALNSMGLAPALGAGLALGELAPVGGCDKVVVIEGDGGMLMGLGSIATIALHRPHRLVLVVLDNGVHASTGSQPTAAEVVDLGALASSAGLRVVRAGTRPELDAALTSARDEAGPTVVHVRTTPGAAAGVPYLQDDPAAITWRFTQWLARVGAIDRPTPPE